MQKIMTENNNLFWGFHLSVTVPCDLYSLFHLINHWVSITLGPILHWGNWSLELRAWSMSEGTHNVIPPVCWLNPFPFYKD